MKGGLYKSIEVTNPSNSGKGSSQQADETTISLHSLNFRPVGSPEYTPKSPTYEQLMRASTEPIATAVPITGLCRLEKDRRWT